jgi:outer membrane protein TolC
MNQKSIHRFNISCIIALAVLILWWNALNGQTVPVLPPEAGTVPIDTAAGRELCAGRELDSRPLQALDSLELHQLEINLEKAQAEVTQTNFLHRLLPDIHVSAGYGIGNLVFIDPNSIITYNIPKDAYRLTLTLSLSELLYSVKHSQALFQQKILLAEYQHKKLLQLSTRQTLQQEVLSVESKIQSLETEASMIRDLIHFNELRFEQGKIEYDVLIRTKLELLSLQTNINTLKNQRIQLLLKIQ